MHHVRNNATIVTLSVFAWETAQFVFGSFLTLTALLVAIAYVAYISYPRLRGSE